VFLKGANQGDLPIEQPREFRRTRWGLTIPQSVLLRAHQVIQ
jgi:hypothetical protein